jgi:hypothetical protein
MQSSTFEHNRIHRITCISNKAQNGDPWPNLVLAMTREVVVPLDVVIPKAPFVYYRSHKDLSVLALRE